MIECRGNLSIKRCSDGHDGLLAVTCSYLSVSLRWRRFAKISLPQILKCELEAAAAKEIERLR
jgi:hypothetical protein